MIAYLEGTIIAHSNTGIVVQVGSVGYDVMSFRLKDRAVGEFVSLYTALHVGGDNQPILLGFGSLEERSIYWRLIKVPGVGPKTALRIVESASLDSLKRAIVEGDYTFFTRVKGLGKKNAQKIILELKNILVDSVGGGSPRNQVLYDALHSLKFTSQEIDHAVSKLDLTNLSDDQAIKLILQSMGK